ncbi:MAG: hypothetical protein QXQ53_08280 [Candidatus Methanosuratincola sp.]
MAGGTEGVSTAGTGEVSGGWGVAVGSGGERVSWAIWAACVAIPHSASSCWEGVGVTSGAAGI